MTLNVSIFGVGQVGGPLVDLINQDNRLKLVGVSRSDNQTVLSNEKPDIVIEAIGPADYAKLLLLQAMRNGHDVISCNKEAIRLYSDELFKCAEENNVTIYLTSIVAGFKNNEFPTPLTHKNFNEYLNLNPFGFRGAGGKETAQEMYNDILRSIDNPVDNI
jgi:homoserine dehydrogenase